jgi:hypothetical protein
MAFLAVLGIVWPLALVAQAPDGPADTVMPGDWWKYDRTDQITGLPMATFTSAVTEVSPKEIVTRLIFDGRNGSGAVVFDHDWNRTVDGALRYKPNDGHGIRLPLQVGKEWRIEFEQRNAQNGVNMKGTSLSKVTMQEMTTTQAGTFDTYRIERQVREVNAADPSRSIEHQFVLWFAPQINHWVRRTTLTKVEKRTRASTMDELVAFGRKQ